MHVGMMLVGDKPIWLVPLWKKLWQLQSLEGSLHKLPTRCDGYAWQYPLILWWRSRIYVIDENKWLPRVARIAEFEKFL